MSYSLNSCIPLNNRLNTPLYNPLLILLRSLDYGIYGLSTEFSLESCGLLATSLEEKDVVSTYKHQKEQSDEDVPRFCFGFSGFGFGSHALKAALPYLVYYAVFGAPPPPDSEAYGWLSKLWSLFGSLLL